MIPEAEPSPSGRRQHDRPRADEAVWPSGGVVRGSTVTRACRATGATVLVPSSHRWSRSVVEPAPPGNRLKARRWRLGPEQRRSGGTPGERGGLAASDVFNKGRQGCDDKDTHHAAGPATKTVRQGEG